MSLLRWALGLLCFGCEQKNRIPVVEEAVVSPTESVPISFWHQQNVFVFVGLRLLAVAALLVVLVYAPLTWVESRLNGVREAEATTRPKQSPRGRRSSSARGWGGRRCWNGRRSASQDRSSERSTQPRTESEASLIDAGQQTEVQQPVRTATKEEVSTGAATITTKATGAEEKKEDPRAPVKFGSATRLPDDSPPINIVRRNPLRKPVTFHWNGGGKQVHLSGSFFSWLRRIPMEYNSKSLRHEVTIMLPIGYHEYKFFVDGVYCTSDSLPTCYNPFGTKNHKLRVM